MGSIMFCASCQEHHAPCDEMVKQLTAATQRADVAEQQRDALAAQNAELVAALREIENDFPTGDEADYCQMQGCIGGKGRRHKGWCPGETARAALALLDAAWKREG